MSFPRLNKFQLGSQVFQTPILFLPSSIYGTAFLPLNKLHDRIFKHYPLPLTVEYVTAAPLSNENVFIPKIFQTLPTMLSPRSSFDPLVTCPPITSFTPPMEFIQSLNFRRNINMGLNLDISKSMDSVSNDTLQTLYSRGTGSGKIKSESSSSDSRSPNTSTKNQNKNKNQSTQPVPKKKKKKKKTHSIPTMTKTGIYCRTRSGSQFFPFQDWVKLIDKLHPSGVQCFGPEIPNDPCINTRILRKNVDFLLSFESDFSKVKTQNQVYFSTIGGGRSLWERYRSISLSLTHSSGYYMSGFGLHDPNSRVDVEVDHLLASFAIQAVKEQQLFANTLLRIGTSGYPSEILSLVNLGYDLFDISLLSTISVSGKAAIFPFQPFSNQNDNHSTELFLNLSKDLKGDYHNDGKNDTSPLVANCGCFTCSNGYSRGYLRHLYSQNELLCGILLESHNIYHYAAFFVEIRNSISAGIPAWQSYMYLCSQMWDSPILGSSFNFFSPHPHKIKVDNPNMSEKSQSQLQLAQPKWIQSNAEFWNSLLDKDPIQLKNTKDTLSSTDSLANLVAFHRFRTTVEGQARSELNPSFSLA